MQTSIDQTKWYDRIWAALIFFTRLPFWRLHQPPKECYATVVEHWPLVGWLTGGVMAAVLYFGSMVFDDRVMREMLTPEVYHTLRLTIDENAKLDVSCANAVAEAMKNGKP